MTRPASTVSSKDAGGTVTYWIRRQVAGSAARLLDGHGADRLGVRRVSHGAVAGSNVAWLLRSGRYELWATYSGDAHNAAPRAPCGSESIVVRSRPVRQPRPRRPAVARQDRAAVRPSAPQRSIRGGEGDLGAAFLSVDK